MAWCSDSKYCVTVEELAFAGSKYYPPLSGAWSLCVLPGWLWTVCPPALRPALAAHLTLSVIA
jgi:hypothetical protein